MTTVYIMRHGQAEAGAAMADEDRRLTAEGHRALAGIAAGLQRQEVQIDSVVCSPLVRARQTAEDMLHVLAPDRRAFVCPLLAPGHPPARVVRWLQEHISQQQAVLVVGHLPDLGLLTAYLLAGPSPDGGFIYQPGGMARVDVQGNLREGTGILRWLMLPEQLMALTGKEA